MADFLQMNPDQARESVNSAQRYAAWRDAKRKARGFQGSLVWHTVGGDEYLTRSYYDTTGRRRQKVEGRRGPDTERRKDQWDRGRIAAEATLDNLKAALARQTAVNRALKLGRVPLTTARIVRAIDRAGLLGNGIRVVGTNALYCYESAAGVFLDAGVTATQDVDLLMDARRSLKMVADEAVPDGSLIELLRKIDRSFEKTGRAFTASNQDGFSVDLIKPHRNPPWTDERERLGASEEDLVAAAIEGLAWLESSSSFESIVVDERGAPLRMVAVDPRVFAAHKLWVSKQSGREPVKRTRDRLQAEVVAALVGRYFGHLPFVSGSLRMLPQRVFRDAQHLFAQTDPEDQLS